MRILLLVLTFGIVANADAQSIITETKAGIFDAAKDFRPVIEKNGKTLESSRGVWRTQGYGYLVEISETKAQLFSESRAGVWKHRRPAELFIRFDATGNSAQITAEPLEPPYVAERIEGLPSAYRSDAEWTPTRLNDVFAATMSENYVFFEERSFDWDER